MDVVFAGLRWVHLVAGFIGLAAFWVPVFAKKGALNHRRFGQIFVNAGYVVVFGAALSLSLKMVMILIDGVPFKEAQKFWSFALFLGYLALVTGALLHHATSVLTQKKNQLALNTVFNRILANACGAASVFLILYGLLLSPPMKIVLFALSPIGLIVRGNILAYISGRVRSKRQWWYEHMTATLTAGIAFHTAFAVFGASQLFDIGLTGAVAVIPWILPTLIGVPGMTIWQNHYRKKFNDPKQPQAAS